MAAHFVGQVLVLGVAEAPYLIALNPLGLDLLDHVIVVLQKGLPKLAGELLESLDAEVDPAASVASAAKRWVYIPFGFSFPILMDPLMSVSAKS